MSVEFYRESPGKFDSRTLNRKTLNRWTGRTSIESLDKSWSSRWSPEVWNAILIVLPRNRDSGILSTQKLRPWPHRLRWVQHVGRPTLSGTTSVRLGTKKLRPWPHRLWWVQFAGRLRCGKFTVLRGSNSIFWRNSGEHLGNSVEIMVKRAKKQEAHKKP